MVRVRTINRQEFMGRVVLAVVEIVIVGFAIALFVKWYNKKPKKK